MPASSQPTQEPPVPASAEELRATITQRHAVRVHVALILGACFAVGLAVTKLLLMAGVDRMWLRYAVALAFGYGAFLAGVWIWLRYAGFDRQGLPGKRSSIVRDAADAIDVGYSGGGDSGKGFELPGFRGGGGGSGGGGASARFGGASLVSNESSSSPALAMPSGGSSGKSGGGGSGFGFDLGDGGWVLVALIALLAALFGAVAWVLFAAPTILADAGFAALLSAGLVRSARRIAAVGWVGSVVGHTWLPFLAVFALAMVFAVVAQNAFPDARTFADVLRRL